MKEHSQRTISTGIISGIFAVFVLLVALLSRTSSVPRSELPSSVTLKPLATWTDELILKSGEPPSGWRLGGLAWNEILGLPSRTYWFKHLPIAPLGTALSESFSVYSTTLLAELAYPKMINKFFPSAYGKSWKTIPELLIKDHADEIKIACLPGDQFNGSPNKACSSIARYQNVIVQVNGIVHLDQWLTLSDFRQMLEAVDHRVTKVLAQLP